MNEPRNIRFLIPPFFFYFTAVLAGYFAGVDYKEQLESLGAEQMLAIAAAVGAASLPIGYLLTSISILFLNTGAQMFGAHTYESHLSEEAFKTIWGKINVSSPPNRNLELYAIAT